MSGDRAVVVGGGLAGISAALSLAEAGLRVTVLEARPWLGGATWSFGRRGLTIDNGQHIFLRCFTAYRDLLANLGVSDSVQLQDRLDVTVLAADGPLRLRRTGWPAPAHLSTMLARYRPLTLSERAGVLPAAMAMWLSDLAGPGSEHASVGDWLRRHGQSEQAVAQFWETFLVPFMNASAAETDLGTAAGFINAALLSRRDQADLGIACVPLRDLHAGPAARRLAEVGAEVLLGAQVTGVRLDSDGGYVVQLSAGAQSEVPGQLVLGTGAPEAIKAASVVLAVPAWAAASLVPAELTADTASWGQLKPSPVISVHVIYGTQVTRLPFAMTAGSPLRWITDKTRSAGLHTGQYLAASVPVAEQLVDEPPAGIRAQILPELARLFPDAASAKVEDFFVTRERSATFRPAPGSRELRPAQATRLAGLAIAGAWTDTGWPDTMEGAVRSGRLAADAILTGPAGSDARAPGRRDEMAASQAPALAGADSAIPAPSAASAAADPAGTAAAGEPGSGREPSPEPAHERHSPVVAEHEAAPSSAAQSAEQAEDVSAGTTGPAAAPEPAGPAPAGPVPAQRARKQRAKRQAAKQAPGRSAGQTGPLPAEKAGTDAAGGRNEPAVRP